jgi:hypothetical protein
MIDDTEGEPLGEFLFVANPSMYVLSDRAVHSRQTAMVGEPDHFPADAFMKVASEIEGHGKGFLVSTIETYPAGDFVGNACCRVLRR